MVRNPCEPFGAVDFSSITPPAITGMETVHVKDEEMLAVLPKNHPLADHPVFPDF